MKTRKFVIPPGEPFEIAVQGDYVRVKQSSVDLLIENADAGESVEMSEGEDFDFSMFKTLRISHEDAAAQTVKLTISKGKRGGSAKVGGSVSIAGPVEVSNFPARNGTVYQTRGLIGSGASVQIRPANANRKYLFIQNNDPSAIMRVRFANGAAADIGIRLQPGESWDTSNFVPTDSVHCIMETATTATYNIDYIEG